MRCLPVRRGAQRPVHLQRSPPGAVTSRMGERGRIPEARPAVPAAEHHGWNGSRQVVMAIDMVNDF